MYDNLQCFSRLGRGFKFIGNLLMLISLILRSTSSVFDS